MRRAKNYEKEERKIEHKSVKGNVKYEELKGYAK